MRSTYSKVIPQELSRFPLLFTIFNSIVSFPCSVWTDTSFFMRPYVFPGYRKRESEEKKEKVETISVVYKLKFFCFLSFVSNVSKILLTKVSCQSGCSWILRSDEYRCRVLTYWQTFSNFTPIWPGAASHFALICTTSRRYTVCTVLYVHSTYDVSGYRDRTWVKCKRKKKEKKEKKEQLREILIVVSDFFRAFPPRGGEIHHSDCDIFATVGNLSSTTMIESTRFKNYLHFFSQIWQMKLRRS